MTRFAALLVGAGALLVVGELVLRPPPRDRVTLLLVFLGVSVAAVVAGRLVHTWTRRSLWAAVTGTAVAAVGVAALAVVAAAGTMFLSAHDLRLVLLALAMGVGAALTLALGIVGPLRADLRGLRDAVASISSRGGTRPRTRPVATSVRRRDELGDAARAIDELAARLEHAEEARAQTEDARRAFLAAVGHDLRSPLASLQSGLEALQAGLVDDPDRTHAALQHEITRMAALVDDLFLLARIEGGGLDLVRERLDLAELADEAVEAVRPVAARRGVTLAVAGTGPAPVTGSAHELGRVLRNLLDNAVRHSPDDGEVVVAVTDEPAPTVVVTDDGPGFPEDLLEEAFDPFVRGGGARVRDGAGGGLGLAIVHGLVEAHGGAVRALSGPGGRVEVELPPAPG